MRSLLMSPSALTSEGRKGLSDTAQVHYSAYQCVGQSGPSRFQGRITGVILS